MADAQGDEREALVDFLIGDDAHHAIVRMDPNLLAKSILASPWLAAHDAQVRAEALREAAEWKRQHNLGNSVWGGYLEQLAHEKYRAGGDDMITIWLEDRADRIASTVGGGDAGEPACVHRPADLPNRDAGRYTGDVAR